jgi:hypothetical protein
MCKLRGWNDAGDYRRTCLNELRRVWIRAVLVGNRPWDELQLVRRGSVHIYDWEHSMYPVSGGPVRSCYGDGDLHKLRCGAVFDNSRKRLIGQLRRLQLGCLLVGLRTRGSLRKLRGWTILAHHRKYSVQ